MKTKHARAFTVLEVLIATALSAMIILAIGTAMAVTGRAVAGNDRLIRARQGCSLTLDYMLQRIREAPYIQLQNAAGVDQPAATSAPGIFIAETIDPASLVITHWKVFTFANGRLKMSSDGATAVDFLPAYWTEQSVVFKSPADATRSKVTIEMLLRSPEMSGDLNNMASMSMSGSAVSRAVQ